MLEQLCRVVGQPFFMASLQWAHWLPLPRSFSHAHAMVTPLELDRKASRDGSSCNSVVPAGAGVRRRSSRSTSPVDSDESRGRRHHAI